MPELLWAFDCLESKEMGAYPPDRIKLAYANRLQKKEADLPRAVALGREVPSVVFKKLCHIFKLSSQKGYDTWHIHLTLKQP